MKGNFLKERTERRLENIFARMACDDPKKAVHATAASAAAIVAVLPIGIDAWALRLSEILMLMSIYSHYNIKLSRATAESLLSAAFLQGIGEAAAYTTLEAADAAAVATGGLSAPATYAICFGVAAGLIEAVGHATIKYLEGSKAAEKVIHVCQAGGGVMDACRIGNAVKNIQKEFESSELGVSKSGAIISFTGSSDISDLTERVEYLKRKLANLYEHLKYELNKGEDTTRTKNAIQMTKKELAYAEENLAKALRHS